METTTKSSSFKADNLLRRSINVDVLIVGAGLLGSSTAMQLSQKHGGSLSVAVIDLDLDGEFSSSELNAGGVRATWNHPVNAAISKTSIEYFERYAAAVGFRQLGYFWMYDRDSWPKAQALLSNNANLKDVRLQFLEPTEIKNKYSFLDKLDDVGGATYSPKDGLLNANLLKLHYRDEAKKNGVQFYNRLWAYACRMEDRIRVRAAHFGGSFESAGIRKVLTEQKSMGFAESPYYEISAKVLVNCCGPWARTFAETFGAPCDSRPVRRQVSVFECKDVDISNDGMFVDTSGVYFHSEGPNILGGYAIADEPAGFNFNYDGEVFFQEYIWPSLYNRSTKFESLRHVTGWAGLYEVSPDHSGIVGRVPGFDNVFEAHSFSGRGAMQSYGAGLGLSELILFNKYRSLDLSPLSGERFRSGQLISESLVI